MALIHLRMGEESDDNLQGNIGLRVCAIVMAHNHNCPQLTMGTFRLYNIVDQTVMMGLAQLDLPLLLTCTSPIR